MISISSLGVWTIRIFAMGLHSFKVVATHLIILEEGEEMFDVLPLLLNCKLNIPHSKQLSAE